MNQKQRIKDMIADIRSTLKTTTCIERIDGMLKQLMLAVESSDIGDPVEQIREQFGIAKSKIATAQHVALTFFDSGRSYIDLWDATRKAHIVNALSWEEFCEAIELIPGKD